jgi:phosphatidylserine synthase
MFQYAFQGIPLVLALVAILACVFRYRSEDRTVVRLQMVLHIVAAVLLVVAQSSWWRSYLIEGSLLGTVFANYHE